MKIGSIGAMVKGGAGRLAQLTPGALRLFSILSLSWSTAAASNSKEIVRIAKPAIVFLKVGDGSGTGFFVSEDGKIVTNYHVIDPGDKITAIMSSGVELKIEGVWAVDAANDLAILQAPPGRYPILRLNPQNEVPQGSQLFVLGHPAGLLLTLSDGILSATRKPDELKEFIGKEKLPTAEVLQITAPISPGSSGSPVMLENGEVIGVASSILSSGQNLNFAAPVSILRSMLDGIKPDQKLMSLNMAKDVAQKTTNYEILWNLLISAAFFGGLILGCRWLAAQSRRYDG